MIHYQLIGAVRDPYIEINKNQKPVSLYYQSIKESFIFHPVAMLPIKDFNKTGSLSNNG